MKDNLFTRAFTEVKSTSQGIAIKNKIPIGLTSIGNNLKGLNIHSYNPLEFVRLGMTM